MAFLDWLKQYLPEDNTGMPNEDMTSDPSLKSYQPTGKENMTPAAGLGALNNLLNIQPKPANQSLPGGGLDYGNTFLRTPVDETKTKAADTIRSMFFPQEQKELTSPAPMTPMREPSPEQEKIETLLKSTLPKKEEQKPEDTEVKVPVSEEKKSETPITDDELIAAQKARSEQLKMANILEGLATAGTAFATRGGSSYKELTPDAFKGMRDSANLHVTEVKEKREAKQADIENKLKQMSLVKAEGEHHSDVQKQDPNSDISKLYRDTLKQSFPQLKVDGMSAANLEKIMPALLENARVKDITEARKENAKLMAEAKGIQREERQERTEFNQQEKYQKALSKIDADNREATVAFEQAAEAANMAKTNDNAAKNLPRYLIKAIEGKGARVSDKDFSSAMGSEAVGRKMYETYTRLATGNINSVTQKEINEMMGAAQKIQNRNHGNAVKSEVERFAKRAKMSPEEAADIGVVNRRIIQPEDENVRIQTPDGRVGVIPKSKLKEALKLGAKEL